MLIVIGSESASIPEPLTIFSLLNNIFKNHQLATTLHEWQNLFFSAAIAIFLSLFFHYASRKRELIPSSLQNFCEWLVETLQNLLEEIMGKEGKRYLPFLGTLFLYILSMNLIGLIPLMKPPTSSLNTTIALAIVVFFVVQFLQFKNRGILGYLYHLAGEPKSAANWALSPLIFFLDLIGQFTRPLTLAFRLFGNVFGEEVLIAYFTMLGIVILSALHFFGGFPIQLPFMLFSAFVSVLQALVFTMLSAIYITLSFPHDEKEEFLKITE